MQEFIVKEQIEILNDVKQCRTFGEYNVLKNFKGDTLYHKLFNL